MYREQYGEYAYWSMVFNIFSKVESEYGSYFTCDHQYMSHLQEVIEQHLGKDVILFRYLFTGRE